MNSEVARQYDLLADKFASWNPSRNFQLIFESAVLESLNDYGHRPISILDAGCGHGVWLSKVLSYCERNGYKANVTGVDASSKRIEIAARELGNRTGVNLICDTLEQVPLPQLDLIYSLEVFEYLTDQEQSHLLKRWWGALVPGGAVIIVDKDRLSLHSIKVEIQKYTGSVGRWLFRLFPKEYTGLLATTRYPSFSYLLKVARWLGYQPAPLSTVGEFTSLKLVRPFEDGPSSRSPSGTRCDS